MMSPRHLEVTYCDDVRMEQGNKLSLMGIYSGDLHVSGPTVLPKLCIIVKAVTDIQEPFESLVVRVLQGDDEVELISTGPVVIPADFPNAPAGQMTMVAQLAFLLTPYQIDTETVLRIRAKTER
jgi:hypothetical protein